MNTFMHLEHATMQWLVQSYQRRTLRRAIRHAYANFVRTHPNWVAQLFDEHFIHNRVLPALHRAAAQGESITAKQVAEMWAQQVSLLPTQRQQHIARIMPAATHFLCMVSDELDTTQVGPRTNHLVETAVG